MENEVTLNIPTIIYGAGSAIVGFIGLLLKRSINQLDATMEAHATKLESHERRISQIDERITNHKEVTDLKFSSLQTNISQRLDAIEHSQQELKEVARNIQEKLGK